MNFKIMKVFDCQDMPENIRKVFFDVSDVGNDCYVRYCIGESLWEDDDDWGIKYTLIDNWLIENGAGCSSEGKSGEEVIIKHWW